MKTMYQYRIVCQHRDRVRTSVFYITIAVNPTDALIRFMNWHNQEYPHRRAYNVVCELVSIDGII